MENCTKLLIIDYLLILDDLILTYKNGNFRWFDLIS